MSNLIDYAKEELSKIYTEEALKEPYNKFAYDSIMTLVTTFSNQCHTGFTAPYTINMFERLAMFKPVTPLTGEDDEWIKINDSTWQNKRCSSVFKNDSGQAYDIEGKIFSRDGGETWFTSSDSHVDITFPYTPPVHPEEIILQNNEE